MNRIAAHFSFLCASLPLHGRRYCTTLSPLLSVVSNLWKVKDLRPEQINNVLDAFFDKLQNAPVPTHFYIKEEELLKTGHILVNYHNWQLPISKTHHQRDSKIIAPFSFKGYSGKWYMSVAVDEPSLQPILNKNPDAMPSKTKGNRLFTPLLLQEHIDGISFNAPGDNSQFKILPKAMFSMFFKMAYWSRVEESLEKLQEEAAKDSPDIGMVQKAFLTQGNPNAVGHATFFYPSPKGSAKRFTRPDGKMIVFSSHLSALEFMQKIPDFLKNMLELKESETGELCVPLEAPGTNITGIVWDPDPLTFKGKRGEYETKHYYDLMKQAGLLDANGKSQPVKPKHFIW